MATTKGMTAKNLFVEHLKAHGYGVAYAKATSSGVIIAYLYAPYGDRRANEVRWSPAYQWLMSQYREGKLVGLVDVPLGLADELLSRGSQCR
jgi:hypothetical protein